MKSEIVLGLFYCINFFDLTSPDAPPLSCDFSDDGKVFAAGCDNKGYVWDLQSNNKQQIAQVFRYNVTYCHHSFFSIISLLLTFAIFQRKTLCSLVRGIQQSNTGMEGNLTLYVPTRTNFDIILFIEPRLVLLILVLLLLVEMSEEIF